MCICTICFCMCVVYFVFWYVKHRLKKKKKNFWPTYPIFFFYVTPIKQFFFRPNVLHKCTYRLAHVHHSLVTMATRRENFSEKTWLDAKFNANLQVSSENTLVKPVTWHWRCFVNHVCMWIASIYLTMNMYPNNGFALLLLQQYPNQRSNSKQPVFKLRGVPLMRGGMRSQVGAQWLHEEFWCVSK